MKLIFLLILGMGLVNCMRFSNSQQMPYITISKLISPGLLLNNSKTLQTSLRPADSRILIALGVTFSKLRRKSDAEKCFKKAFQIGDVEGNALIHLAK